MRRRGWFVLVVTLSAWGCASSGAPAPASSTPSSPAAECTAAAPPVSTKTPASLPPGAKVEWDFDDFTHTTKDCYDRVSCLRVPPDQAACAPHFRHAPHDPTWTKQKRAALGLPVCCYRSQLCEFPLD